LSNFQAGILIPHSKGSLKQVASKKKVMRKKIKISIIALLIGSANAFAQSTINGIGGAGHGGGINGITHYCGWDPSTTMPFRIKHMRQDQPIILSTGGGALGTSRIFISSNVAGGLIAVGPGFQTPNNMLDVDQGHIDVNTATMSYKIDNQSVLWHKSGTANIFVGVGAGAAHPANSQNNTFVGNNSGMSNTSGSNNTYLGFQAGQNSTFELANTYVGSFAGANAAATSDENVFVGYHTGENVTGVHNTFAGNIAGVNSKGTNNAFFGIGSGVNNFGSQNCLFGASAGANVNGADNILMGVNSGLNLKGSNNVAVGGSSGPNTVGNDNTYVGSATGAAVTTGAANTYIGANANSSIASINNSGAIGANAQVVTSDNMIIGDLKVNTGIGLSGITPGPQNKLEINDNLMAGPNNPNPNTSPASFGSSGLRLRKMTTATTDIMNPGKGVLSVDNNGDVIYVTAAPPMGCCIGNACAPVGVPNPLANDWQVPLGTNINPHTYNFTSAPTTGGSQVNIGFSSCTSGPGRLNTTTDNHRFAGAFTNNNGFAPGFQCVGVGGQATSTNVDAIGVRGQAQSAPLANNAVGVEGASSNPASTAGSHMGIHGIAQNGKNESRGGSFEVPSTTVPSNTNIGVSGFVGNQSNNASSENFGGIFTSTSGGDRNIGVIGGIATSAAMNPQVGIAALLPNMRIGVYGYHPVFNSPALIANTITDWAGYFDGDLRVTGNAFGPTFWTTSDKRYKTNIQQLTNVREKLNQLSGYSYEFANESMNGYHFNKGKQIGFIAQELKEVFPELVTSEVNGYLAVNYQGMIPVLVEAIKDQQKQIDEKTGNSSEVQKQIEDLKKSNEELKNQNNALSNKLDQLEQMITSCFSANQNGAKASGSQIVKLSDKNIIVLNQNVPNPFAESTVISYNIPVDFSKAQLIFTANDGRLIKTVDVTTKGEGSFNVFANDLSNGLYTYSLVVDGKVISTKKMVKQN
jgi:hypothetical protein